MKKLWIGAAIFVGFSTAGASIMAVEAAPRKTMASCEQDVDVQQNNSQLNYDSVGTLNLAGSGNKIVIRGRCKSLNIAGNNNVIIVQRNDAMAISGSGNRVTSQIVQKIEISGNNNKIVWRKSLSPKGPSVSTYGSGNSVSRARR